MILKLISDQNQTHSNLGHANTDSNTMDIQKVAHLKNGERGADGGENKYDARRPHRYNVSDKIKTHVLIIMSLIAILAMRIQIQIQ